MRAQPVTSPNIPVTGQISSALLVVPQRIGDVLLATPIIASLKRSSPGILTDVLVFSGTEGILAGNADVRNIIVVSQRESLAQKLAMFRKLWRRYDLAITVLCGDRPLLYTWAAGRYRVGPVQSGVSAHAWKRFMLSRHVVFDDRQTHTVRMGLRIAQLAGIVPVAQVQACWGDEQERTALRLCDEVLNNRPFAVLHPTPKFLYKRWHAAGWRELADWLLGKGMQVVLTGGNEEQERRHAREIFEEMPAGVHDLIGRYSLGEIAALLSRARVYIGPDTVTTHLAAALGIPTVALFGPSNPVKWGPWPKDHDAARNPYTVKGTQRAGNVVLVQGEGSCVPCSLEGCDRHTESYSQCLQTMPAKKVRVAVETLIGQL
ncbi:MAG: glycosyltransferase family 9 protein [Betaproteobacteria bacterium]|nr:glycosyltransferase family 9 protein [Betaproteobacteria bacterium]